MKVVIELKKSDDKSDDEMIIRCREVTPEIISLSKAVESGAFSQGEECHAIRQKEILLSSASGEEFIIPFCEILFFDTAEGRVSAHTRDRMLYSSDSLSSLMLSLPGYFVRASKSCIVNIPEIASLKRELTGICEVTFSRCEKKVYVSRMYYKTFRERLFEIRLST